MKTKITLLVVVALVVMGSAYLLNRLMYEPKDEIVIGAIFDLTGSLSYMGQWSLEGAKLAETHVNAAGGVDGKLLRLLVDDAETSPQRAVTIFQRMINIDKVPIVIGFNGSSEVMAAAPVANRSHVVLFSSGGASPRITAAGDYVFRNRLSGAIEAARMAEIARGTLDFKNGFILYINTDYGEGYAEAFRARFTALGGTITTREAFNQDQTDFRAQLLQVQGTPDLDFVYLASHVREAGWILKQARELGISTTWLASNAVEGPELFDIAGSAAEAVLLTVAHYDPNDPAARTFNQEYRKRYGRDSEMFAAHAYDAVRIVADLIGEVGYDGNLLKSALYDLADYPGVSGVTSFDENGDVVKEVGFKIAHEGAFFWIEEEDARVALGYGRDVTNGQQ